MSKQEQMFERIGAWQRSGLSQKTWCDQNDMAYATFQYWYKRFRSPQTAQPGTANSFVPLLVDTLPASCWCELLFGDGRRLVFHQPVSASFLQTLMG